MEEIMSDHEEDTVIGSPSSEGSKMVIKLKIPKLDAAVSAAVEGEKSPEKVTKRVCPECKKEFSSGKALGGHMRIHVQSNSSSNKNPTKFKQGFNNGGGGHEYHQDMKKKEKKPYYMNSVNDEGKPTCSQCGKTFPSMKSLFGHMRCHPERFWRGILPPPPPPQPTTRGGGGGGDHVVDLTKFIQGWSVTERRGRKSLKLAADDEDDDEVLLEAVEDLMSLASMAESDVISKKKQLKVDVIEGSNSNSLTNKAVMEDEIIAAVKFEYSDNESESYRFKKNLLTSPNKMKKKKKKKMKLMMELEQNTVVTGGLVTPPPLEQPAECKYKCTTCNKCFTTHQALGGHRSSHNKLKSTDDYDSFVTNHSGEITEKEVEFAGDIATGAPASGNSVHQCRICAKVFATGQALGGHQRCHWSGAIEAQTPSSQITSTGEGASQTGSGRKVLDFDLNEIPPVMMEDEGGNGNGNGNGYASSSYNSNILV